MAQYDSAAGRRGEALVEGRHPRVVTVQPLGWQRLALAKKAFTTRRAARHLLETFVSGNLRPRAGDLVLARVDRLGQHAKLELFSGRRASLHEGDEILVTYGNRYAADQFEAYVPTDLGPTQLVASGGVAAKTVSRSRLVGRATDITPIGLIGNARGTVLNVSDFALDPIGIVTPHPPCIAFLGTGMNAGKTTAMRHLVHGLTRAGEVVGAAKVTGTGSGADSWVMLDAGAHTVLDFTDVGMATTFCAPLRQVENKFVELVDHLAGAGSTVVLVEIADGLFQRETKHLIRSDAFRRYVDRAVFAAGDAMGAHAGVNLLRALGLNVVAATGILTRSPLAHREATAFCDVPVLTLDELRDPGRASELAGVTRLQEAPLAEFTDRLADPSASTQVAEESA